MEMQLFRNRIRPLLIKENYMFFTFFMLSIISLQGQDNIKFGVKAGYDRTGFHDGYSSHLDNDTFHVGGIVELVQSDFFSIKGELLYDRKAGFLVFTLNNRSRSVDTKLDYISLPLYGKITLLKNLSLEGGPELGFLFSEKGTLVLDDSAFELPETNLFEFSVGGGLNYQFLSHMLFQIRYSAGVSKIFKDLEHTNTALSLSLGYIF